MNWSLEEAMSAHVGGTAVNSNVLAADAILRLALRF